jgi:hypothetical protein
METLEALLKRHEETRVPGDVRGVEVSGIELMMLAETVDGCVSAFVERPGQFDLWRTAVLGLCYGKVLIVLAGC